MTLSINGDDAAARDDNVVARTSNGYRIRMVVSRRGGPTYAIDGCHPRRFATLAEAEAYAKRLPLIWRDEGRDQSAA